MNAKTEEKHTEAQYVSYITTALTGATERQLTAGKWLTEAKDALKLSGDNWEKWLRTHIGIGKSYASKLMKVAGNTVVVSQAKQLPPDIEVLYTLAGITTVKLTELITSGTVTRETTREDALKLAGKTPPAATTAAPAAAPAPDIRANAEKVNEQVRADAANAAASAEAPKVPEPDAPEAPMPEWIDPRQYNASPDITVRHSAEGDVNLMVSDLPVIFTRDQWSDFIRAEYERIEMEAAMDDPTNTGTAGDNPVMPEEDHVMSGDNTDTVAS